MNQPDLNLKTVSSLSFADLNRLTSEQEAVFEALRDWIFDFNLGKAPKPNLDSHLGALVSLYSERKMAAQVMGDRFKRTPDGMFAPILLIPLSS